jgi:signal transduction histidine kinase
MVLFRLTSDPFYEIVWTRSLFIAGSFIGISFLFFSFIFPTDKLDISKFKKNLIIFLNLLSLIIIIQPSFIREILPKEASVRPLKFNNVLYVFYSAYLIGFFVWGFKNLMEKYKIYRGAVRTQIGYMFWGSLFSVFFGLLFDIVLPFGGDFRFYWLGPVLTIIMFSVIAYAIVKHQVMDVKVIATETLTLFIIIILVIQTFLSQSWSEFVLRFIFLILVSFFGLLLIRSVTLEVNRREEFQKLARKLSEANKKLKKLDQAKSEFISIASHQLRTPLSIIKGYLSMILEGDYGTLKELMVDPVHKVYISAERLINLVDNLLDISRIESGRLHYDFTTLQLADIAESVVHEFKIQAEKKGLDLKYKPPSETLPAVKADSMRIREIIINLVDNAMKYTSKGDISLSLKKEKDRIILCVADTGHGLDKEEKSIIFQKFSRGGGGNAMHVDGSGLGLFIAKKIIQDHGGDIWAESAGRGKGSKFCFSLPLA